MAPFIRPRSIPIVELLAAAAIAVAAGCGSVRYADVYGTDSHVDVSDKSLLLLSVRVEHDSQPGANPVPTGARLLRGDGRRREDRLYFAIGRDAREAALGPMGHESLVRMPVEPGRYTFLSLEGHGCASGWFVGVFMMPLVAEIDVPARSVVYLGRVEGHTRARADDEFMAGPGASSLKQHVCGWNASTWDIAVADAYETDVARFRAAFPALRETEVDRRVMTFDRRRAQAWWDSSELVRSIGIPKIPF